MISFNSIEKADHKSYNSSRVKYDIFIYICRTQVEPNEVYSTSHGLYMKENITTTHDKHFSIKKTQSH
jgi:hypothetical protein